MDWFRILVLTALFGVSFNIFLISNHTRTIADAHHTSCKGDRE